MRARRREAGVSLLEILVALAVLGIGIAAATSYLWQIERQVRLENAKVMQHHLADRLMAALANPDAIRNSIDFNMSSGNIRLRQCVDPSAICTAVSPGDQVEFNLMTPGAGPEIIAGPTVAYSTDGKRCVSGEPRCTFFATTFFWGTCALDVTGVPAASCSSPAYLNFRFSIRPISPGPRSVGSFSDYPPRDTFNADKTSFSVRLRTAEVLLRAQQSCGADQYVKGVDRNGRVICECVVPQAINGRTRTYATDGLGRPVCGEQRCPGNYEIMIGFTNEGTIRCLDERQCSATPMPVDCPCKIVDLSASGDCGPGFWMVSVYYGECEATTVGKGGKGATEKVSCSKHEGRCCKLDTQ